MPEYPGIIDENQLFGLGMVAELEIPDLLQVLEIQPDGMIIGMFKGMVPGYPVDHVAILLQESLGNGLANATAGTCNVIVIHSFNRF
jgi:hypothetical protein